MALSTLRQSGYVALINLQALGARGGLTLATMLCVALAVAILLGLGALNQGLKNTIARSGDANVALLMRGGSQAEINSVVTREQLDVLRNAPGVGGLSAEVNLVVDGYRRSGRRRDNISLRGLNDVGVALRNARLIQGRWPREGIAELAVGTHIAQGYQQMQLGSEVMFGATTWRIVGVFAANGHICESEIWGEITAVQNLFERPNQYQSIRVRLADENRLNALERISTEDPRLQLAVRSEADYYAAQAARTTELAQLLAWPLAILMSIGAVVGALNTMLALVTVRVHEIATLRAIGYRRRAICGGLILESILICLSAGLLGSALVYGLLDGLSANTLGGGITRIGYAFELTQQSVWQGLILAVGIGILGALPPAISACMRPIAAIGRPTR